MDYLQITLTIILIIFAINSIAAGVYFILILKEFRETIQKANEVLDHAEKITGAVSKPVIGVAGILAGLTEGIKAPKGIKSLIGGKD